jgi:outer membrane receptor protein involved in Fe transport
VSGKVGNAELTSVSGYSINELSDSLDFSQVFGGAYGGYAQSFFGVPGAAYVEHGKTNKFSQEFRLSIPLGTHLEWLAGLFYTHESSQVTQSLLAEDPVSGAIPGALLTAPFPTTFEEYAAFTDLTVHFTDQFDIQLGGRESQNKQTYELTESGALFGNNPLLSPKFDTKDNAFTYLVTPEYKFSPNLLVYARFASGYRPGGPNTSATLIGVPLSYEPDKTKNYEVGVKEDFLDHALSIDASLYHIDWKNIQLQVVTPRGGYFTNGSAAKSDGMELSVQARPLGGLTLSSWISWGKAVLTQDFPAGSADYGRSGDRLPFSSLFSGNIALEQEFPLWNNVSGFAGGNLSYTGSRIGGFQGTAVRQEYPAYAKTDLRGGVNYDAWTVALFANNIADKRGVLVGGLDTNPTGYYYITPRTFGVSVLRTF